MKSYISIHNNFLSNNEFEKYLNYSKQIKNWGNRSAENVWSGRVIYQNSIDNFEYLNLLENSISIDYELTEKIYPDYLGLVKWENGDEQHPHADGENENGNHPYYWRNFGCVYYLNDDYDGGEIYFPNQNIELKPKPNTLIFFPGTLEYLHGVKKITNGIRYTLTSFWTFDEKYKIKQ